MFWLIDFKKWGILLKFFFALKISYRGLLRHIFFTSRHYLYIFFLSERDKYIFETILIIPTYLVTFIIFNMYNRSILYQL